MPQETRGDDVWAAEGVTSASNFFIPADELVGWAKETGIEACFFDQNYEFDAVGALRASGVRTIGRFVWERFSDEHVEPTKRAYDLVYSLTRAEQERYATMGIETPYVQYGVHPEYFEITPHRRTPGGPDAKRRIPRSCLFPLPRRAARQAEALQGGHQRLLRHEAARAEADRQGPDRAPDEVPRAGRPEGPAGRAGPRGPPHRRPPADVRRRGRVHGAGPLGGPRPPSLRGDRLRPADRLQRRRADERARRRRRQRDPRPLSRRRPRQLRHPGARRSTSTPSPTRSRASPIPTSAPSSRPARSAPATSAAGIARSPTSPPS